jgi:hypothetical protein
MRTDRNNNPIAAATRTGTPNAFTKALDSAGIPWDYGDVFPRNASMVTIKILGNPVEGARAILSRTGALSSWYRNHTGAAVMAKYGITDADGFNRLTYEQQNAVINGIYRAEGGDGSLTAGISTANPGTAVTAYTPTETGAEPASQDQTTDFSNSTDISASESEVPGANQEPESDLSPLVVVGALGLAAAIALL